MRTERIICDACGKEFVLDDEACYGGAICVPGVEYYTGVDLCSDCNKKLTQFIINFLPNRKPDWVDGMIEEKIKIQVEENKQA